MSDKNLPTIQELYDNTNLAIRNDAFTVLMNQKPMDKWVKTHPYIKGYKYIPIERIEFLIKKIFKSYKIEVLREGTSFNGVYVVVRVHYLHPVTSEWNFHDGIGAIHLQVKKGSTPADLSNINNGALSMAYPHAKTLAIKDACDHFGVLFGSDLNRKDQISYSIDEKLKDLGDEPVNQEKERLELLINNCKTIDQLREYQDEAIDNDLTDLYDKVKSNLK